MIGSVISRGELLDGDALQKENRQRRADRIEDSIPKGVPIPEGWAQYRETKTTIRISKEKDIATKLEDRLWRFFYSLGCKQISSRNFVLVLRRHADVEKTKQIDVMAIDDDIVFVVECKSREHLGKRSLKKDIAEYVLNKPDIESSVKKLLPGKVPKFIHLFATENIDWDENDRLDAKKARIVVWDEYDLMALEQLASLAGEGAKYQIYNRIFFGKEIKGFEVKVPALEARMGGYTYYSLILSPDDLLKIAYVHHRSAQSSFLELADSYQRMIKKSRIREIEEFIKNGGFFPGAIIINFHKDFPVIEELGQKRHLAQLRDNVRPVAITLPPYYGCAWIIDGQHRLYSYADIEEKKKETIPVVAFVKESLSLETKMFVDVNKNQKPIEANLLWDLYEDLYPESVDPSELQLYTISRIAKLLNSDPSSPFAGHITIPKEQNIGNMTLTSVCTGIYQQRLIAEEEGLLFSKSYPETVNFAFDRIATFFNIIRKEMEEEWKAGDKHYIRTNAGFVVLAGILRDIIECNIAKEELIDLEKFRKVTAKFLEPLLLHLITTDSDTIRSYRGAGGAGQKSRQIRYQLTNIIADANIGFRSRWLEKYQDALEEEDKFAKYRQGVVYFLDQDEGELLEFKGSVTLNIDQFLENGTKVELPSLPNEGVLKTITALLNTKGGNLIIGIIEAKRYEKLLETKLAEYPRYKDKVIFGLENEYGKNEWDGFYQRLISLIETRIGPQVLDTEQVRIEKTNFEGRDLCVISVDPADAKQYLLKKFYVRRGNKSVLLEGSEVDHFWLSRQNKPH